MSAWWCWVGELNPRCTGIVSRGSAALVSSHWFCANVTSSQYRPLEPAPWPGKRFGFPPLSLSPLVLNLKGIRSTPGLHWQLGTCSPSCVSKDTSEVTTFVEGAQVLLLGWVDTSPCFFQRLAWWSFTPASIYWSALGGGGPISLGQWRMCCGHAEWAWRMFWHKLL